MPTVTVNAEDIFYVHHGESMGAPIIFIHGAGGTHERWLPQVNGLKNCTAYALDLPGHGQSTGAARDNIQSYSDVLLGFMDELMLSSAIIAGHSLGGAIALWFALSHPKRARGLVFSGTGAKLRVHPNILQAVREGRPVTPDLVTSPVMPAAQPEREPANSVAYADWLACDRFDVMNRLDEIVCPTLVIVGDQDVQTPVKYAQYLKDHIKNARLVIVEGATHSILREKPDAVTNAIQEFVDLFPIVPPQKK